MRRGRAKNINDWQTANKAMMDDDHRGSKEGGCWRDHTNPRSGKGEEVSGVSVKRQNVYWLTAIGHYALFFHIVVPILVMCVVGSIVVDRKAFEFCALQRRLFFSLGYFEDAIANSFKMSY